MTHRGPIAAAAVGAAVSWTPGLATSEGDHSPFAWWDAEVPGTLEAGNRVSLWPDRSGNGWHLPQGMDSARPTWVDAVANGRPVLRFDGGDFLFRAQADGPTWNLQDITLFVAVHETTHNSDAGFMTLSPDATDPSWDDFNRTDALTLYSNQYAQSYYLRASGIALAKNISATAQWTIYTAQVAGAVSTVRYNGVLGGTDTSSSLSTAAKVGLLAAGRWINGAVDMTNCLAGDLAEILVYGALSAADIAQIEAYLAAKWGISLP